MAAAVRHVASSRLRIVESFRSGVLLMSDVFCFGRPTMDRYRQDQMGEFDVSVRPRGEQGRRPRHSRSSSSASGMPMFGRQSGSGPYTNSIAATTRSWGTVRGGLGKDSSVMVVLS